MQRRESDQYKDFSKKRLVNNIKKKFDTTIIGSLAAFERSFGHLWGCEFDEDDEPYLLHYNELNDEQKKWRDIWQETRLKILDNGNSNLRAAQSELSQYTFSWNRYITNFKMRNENYD